jgi:hypothetical protein
MWQISTTCSLAWYLLITYHMQATITNYNFVKLQLAAAATYSVQLRILRQALRELTLSHAERRLLALQLVQTRNAARAS